MVTYENEGSGLIGCGAASKKQRALKPAEIGFVGWGIGIATASSRGAAEKKKIIITSIIIIIITTVIIIREFNGASQFPATGENWASLDLRGKVPWKQSTTVKDGEGGKKKRQRGAERCNGKQGGARKRI